jgi:hypothetical protein
VVSASAPSDFIINVEESHVSVIFKPNRPGLIGGSNS